MWIRICKCQVLIVEYFCADAFHQFSNSILIEFWSTSQDLSLTHISTERNFEKWFRTWQSFMRIWLLTLEFSFFFFAVSVPVLFFLNSLNVSCRISTFIFSILGEWDHWLNYEGNSVPTEISLSDEGTL